MDLQAYRDEIRLKLTGGVLDLELDDKTIDAIINSGLREMQRYINISAFMTVPFAKCIDLSDKKVNTVTNIYRANGYIASESSEDAPVDPMLASQWQLLSGAGNLYNFNGYVYNYAAWNTLLQIRNTVSTDLSFIYDPTTRKLYINTSGDMPDKITIEYIPRYDNVEEITSDYWIDVLVRLSVAMAKVTVGRIRSRFNQSGALYTQDGETILNEGNAELEALRNDLLASTSLNYPID